jgi:hypothetical protein
MDNKLESPGTKQTNHKSRDMILHIYVWTITQNEQYSSVTSLTRDLKKNMILQNGKLAP